MGRWSTSWDCKGYLLSDKDDGQLQADFHVATTGATFLLPVIKQLVVVARVSYELALEEGDVEDGGVVVDELEHVDLQRQRVVKFGLGPVEL